MNYIAREADDLIYSDGQLEYFESVYDFNMRSLIGTQVDSFMNKIENIYTRVYYTLEDEAGDPIDDDGLDLEFDDECDANYYIERNGLDSATTINIVWEIQVEVNTKLTKDEEKILNDIVKRRMKTYSTFTLVE